MKIEKEGSVRVDLLGGTLDIPPINLILNNVVTLNLATGLKAKVSVEKIKDDCIIFESLDYNYEKKFLISDFSHSNLPDENFGPLRFVAYIVKYFKPEFGLRIKLQSGAPTGSGLGGSSAMGVTLFMALSELFNKNTSRRNAIKIVNALESIILNKGPAGYQDYYPALYGGILGLVPDADGVHIMQLFSKELKSILEENLVLVYSGETRNSGINNWEVFKNFFDGDAKDGLQEIADLSGEAYWLIKDGIFNTITDLIAKEGKVRKKLFPGIMTDSMRNLESKLLSSNLIKGTKVCGAGGGGCFILILNQAADKAEVEKFVKDNNMSVLSFNVEGPLS